MPASFSFGSFSLSRPSMESAREGATELQRNVNGSKVQLKQAEGLAKAAEVSRAKAEQLLEAEKITAKELTIKLQAEPLKAAKKGKAAKKAGGEETNQAAKAEQGAKAALPEEVATLKSKQLALEQELGQLRTQCSEAQGQLAVAAKKLAVKEAEEKPASNGTASGGMTEIAESAAGSDVPSAASVASALPSQAGPGRSQEAESTIKRLEFMNKMLTRKNGQHVDADKKTEEALSSMRAELQLLRKQHNEVCLPLGTDFP
jgi:hypothetical protein